MLNLSAKINFYPKIHSPINNTDKAIKQSKLNFVLKRVPNLSQIVTSSIYSDSSTSVLPNHSQIIAIQTLIK